MPRQRRHAPLRVLLDNRLVGYFEKESTGAIHFRYDQDWLNWRDAVPVSLSLPLREDAYRGAPVAAVFENLLPDSDALRRRVAEKVGATGIDAHSLLSVIGRDCVGALQFVPEGMVPGDVTDIRGEPVSDEAIEKLLNNLARAPLGLERDEDFRISVAGAQEKTALLWHEGQWLKPHGTTPTTHILKTQIGSLPNGIDLSNSVENEFYCLKLMAAFGLPVNAAEIIRFGSTKALVVERFDRKWKAGRWLRLPQEDCCQALAYPPSLKYQSEGGPDIVAILKFLKGGDTPADDQKAFLKAHILFWLMGATDGHAKNFSVFIGPGGRFCLTPFYDVMTAQPSVDSRQIERKQMRLAMSVGDRRHYRMDEIEGRHFIQTVERAGLPGALATSALEEVALAADTAFAAMVNQLPGDFPGEIHASVKGAFTIRRQKI